MHCCSANNPKNREIQQSILKAQDQEPHLFFVFPTSVPALQDPYNYPDADEGCLLQKLFLLVLSFSDHPRKGCRAINEDMYLFIETDLSGPRKARKSVEIAKIDIELKFIFILTFSWNRDEIILSGVILRSPK